MAASELATYLRDHLAGSSGGVSLAKRIARACDVPEQAEELSRIATEIKGDQRRLVELAAAAGVRPSRLKMAGAWLGEKAARLKLRSGSAAGRTLQLEALIIGVSGKVELWRALAEISSGNPALPEDEIAALGARAGDQRARLEAVHAEVARGLDPRA